MDNTIDNNNFSKKRIKILENLYSDDKSTNRRYNRSTAYSATNYKTAAAVRKALKEAATDTSSVMEASRQLYATNPIYASVIDYLVNMYTWKYKVIPHRVYTKSKTKARKSIDIEDYMQMYNLMLEVVEGLSIKTTFPALLQRLFVEGAVYFTTLSDDDSLAVDTLILPTKYCKKIGDTQFGTSIISFDMSYFQTQSLSNADLKNYFKSFPKEFEQGYRRYLKNPADKWCELDPHFSSGIMLNEVGIPTYFDILGGILDFEKYQDNELERSDNALKYLVVHTIPHYEDQLIFEVDEVAALHRSLKQVVDTGDKARLITTYGDVKVEKIAETDTAENQILSKAFKAIFNDAGLNAGLFTADSVEALKISLVRDKSKVWHFVEGLISFYNIAINNWFDFKGYEADIDILPISSYTYTDDIKIYKENATLGVNKLDYLIASGIEQKNITDVLKLESILGLENITPMQTSYTQTAEDRALDNETESTDNSTTEIEPSGTETSNDSAITTAED